MLLTIEETKKLTKLSTATIYRMFATGEFKKVKLGRSTRVELPKELWEKYNQ
ncbi:helix-turn-helix transcriptional regulator [Acinetobacter pollinis]|uniref:helix-turn-helix transcriptional regulator n=1 Tax=Acinetobacter pollinis TaxID=2605270 RepID=UPI0018C29274|nr:helix-turn-helix domain-containing protein [Acinetobacter pollinis]MBF7693445.1 helix-turn-helix domain-containing protein [Acinetobacter pollinis]MBF7700957.1 helix-turn-helix domain-containing protein [Acinetobacter pollinis]